MTATTKPAERIFDPTSWKQAWVRASAATAAVIALAPLPTLAIFGLNSSVEDRSADIGFAVSAFWGSPGWWIQVAVVFAAMLLAARKAREPVIRAWAVVGIVLAYVVAGIVCWSVALGYFGPELVYFYLTVVLITTFDAVIVAIVAGFALFLKRHSPRARYR